jgi:predicted lipid carrier protein YhbT
VPLFIAQRLISKIVDEAALLFPTFFDRLGQFDAVTYQIDPVDLSFVVILNLKQGHPTAHVMRRYTRKMHCDARVAACLADLLGLLEGRLDSDALFFARRLVIEGDTTAVVTLRNALDNMDSDILAEALKRFPRHTRRPAQWIFAYFKRKSHHAA